MKKTNLAIFIYSLSSGGAERVVSALLEKLESQYALTLILMNNTIFYKIPKNTKIIYIENSSPNEKGIWKLLKLPYLAWKYKKVCQEEQIDISMSFLYRPNYINILARILGAKYQTIINIRSTTSRYLNEGLQGKINLWLIRHLFNYADCIVSNSYGVEEDLKEIMHITTRTKVIYNPIDNKKIKQLIQQIPSDETRFSFDEQKRYIISVGRLIPLKRNKDLINAFYHLQKQDDTIELLFLGDGTMLHSLQLYTKTLGINRKVHFLGKVTNPFYYLYRSDLFVMTSETEGFPNVLVEAMACGLPVISSDCKSGPREILGDNKYGLLYPVGDVKALLKHIQYYLYDENVDLEQIKERAKERLKDFEIEKIMKKFESIL